MGGSTSRHFTTRVLGALLGFAAAVGLAASCGGSSGGSSSGPMKIGISLPLTGDFSQPGSAAKQGYQVLADTVNSQGGLLGRKVELDIKDDASDQNTVVADYNALISRDNVNLLLGTFSSLLNLPASAVAEKNQMLYVEPAGGSPEMFSRGFKYLFFAQQATADHQGDVFADYVKNLPANERPKTAAYPTLDDPFAQPTSQGIEKVLKAGGIKTVYRKTYTIDQKNFDSIANSVKASGADLVVHGATFEDGVGLVRALLKIGYTPKMLYQTTAPSLGDQYAKGIGKENTEGVFYAVSHSAKAKTPGNEQFVAKYKEMFGGTEVPEDAADAYAAAQVLQAAVKAIGGIDDQAKLADWLHKNKVDTILGPLNWDQAGRPQGKFLVGQWQNGAPEIVLPDAAATVDSPEPQWKPGGSGT